jgi:hypothetical protein
MSLLRTFALTFGVTALLELVFLSNQVQAESLLDDYNSNDDFDTIDFEAINRMNEMKQFGRHLSGNNTKNTNNNSTENGTTTTVAPTTTTVAVVDTSECADCMVVGVEYETTMTTEMTASQVCQLECADNTEKTAFECATANAMNVNVENVKAESCGLAETRRQLKILGKTSKTTIKRKLSGSSITLQTAMSITVADADAADAIVTQVESGDLETALVDALTTTFEEAATAAGYSSDAFTVSGVTPGNTTVVSLADSTTTTAAPTTTEAANNSSSTTQAASTEPATDDDAKDSEADETEAESSAFGTSVNAFIASVAVVVASFNMNNL